jgi:hypothetical protein
VSEGTFVDRLRAEVGGEMEMLIDVSTGRPGFRTSTTHTRIADGTSDRVTVVSV